ncbi:MAG: hypothetical protein WDZ91_16935 [Paenibacillaceae bacterium]
MGIEFIKAKMPLPNIENCGEYKDRKFFHICEVCQKYEILTPIEGYKKGWDYAPYMYPFKVISPRTCNECTIDKTVYFQVVGKHKAFTDLTNEQLEIIKRIYHEPESILVNE